MKKKLLFLVVALAVAFTLSAFPLPQGDASAMGLESRSDFFFNADPRLGIGEVSRPGYASRFTPADGRLLWVGRQAPAGWLRFTIPASDLGPGYGNAKAGEPLRQWLLVVRPSFSIILDHVDLYIPRGDGSFDEIKAGAKAARRPGEPNSRFFVFELPAEAFVGNPCYLRLASATDVSLNFGLETSLGFARREGVDYIAYGLLYGILLAMVLYSFFLFLSLKDIAYLYYILYTVSAALWLFFVQGHSKLLFGQVPFFDQAMLWLWAGMMMTWGAVFTASFLRLKEGRIFLYNLLRALAALGVVVSVVGIAGWDDIAFSLSHYLGLILPISVVIASIARLLQGFPSALYFLIAWSTLAAGGFVFSLMGLKILPLNFWTVNGMAIGMTTEAVLLSMALADRFRRLETEKKNLEKIQAHYRELSLTDALTGLHNKRYLMNELNLAVAGARESGSALSLILLDIDNFKSINDSFGHAMGDEVLASLAHAMRSCTRESDSSCRFGGDELVIIMPGVADEYALKVAERIRTRFASENMRLINGVDMQATVSLGVASFNGKETAETLMARADEAMYEAKRHGKNCSVAL